jgi:hypothetical protein
MRAAFFRFWGLSLVFTSIHCGTSSSATPHADAGPSAPGADSGLDAAASESGSPDGTGPKVEGGLPGTTWNWNGVVGTGQSLSVGTTPITSKTQPYGNLMLSLGSRGNLSVPPWDPTLPNLTMVPLVEPLRALQTGYPSPYPGNLYGETPHSAMANQITFLVKAAAPASDFVTVHTVVGESGQGIVALNKQMPGADTAMTGRAYSATLFEAAAITRSAKAAGKTYGVGVIVMTHGETDSGSSTYKNDLIQLLADYNTDLLPITGQTQKIPMYLSQQHAYPNGATSQGQRPAANQIQWQLGVDHKGDFVCTGPKYQYPGNPNKDGIHLSATGYQLLGEKVAQVYYERIVLGNDWQPLQPTTVERSGRTVTVHFQVPVPPLNWDTSLDPPVIPEWVDGRGFELRAGSTNITIDAVDISGDSVVITADGDLPASGLTVGYALSSQGVQLSTASLAVRWGQLRDSDPFVGSTTQMGNPNYAVSFELPVP